MSIAITEEEILENEIEQDQYLVFSVKGQEFGFKTIRVQEITSNLDTSEVPNAPAYIEGIASLRGRLATVMNFRSRFGFPSKDRDEDTRIIVVEQEGFPIGITVDAVEEVLKIPDEVVQQLPESTASSVAEETITGIGMMKDRLVTLLDVDKVLAGTNAVEFAQTLDKAQSTVESEDSTVEDGPTTEPVEDTQSNKKAKK